MGKFSPRNLIKVPGRKSYHDMILEESGLVSYWNFGAGSGSKAWDQIGVNHGTITGATWTQEANGRQTLDFDGNDRISMGNPGDDSLDMGTDDFSLEIWLKTNYTASTQRFFHKKGATIASAGYEAKILTGLGNMDIVIADGTNSVDFNTSTSVTDNAWHHIVLSVDRDDSSGMKTYVDGEQVGGSRDPTAVDNMNSTRNLFIGARNYNDFYFNGSLNEPAIYNVALSQETILRHYQVGVWKGLAA